MRSFQKAERMEHLRLGKAEASSYRRGSRKCYRHLASWDEPAHVIFGDSDRIFTEEWGRQFAAHIPGATITIVEGQAHRPLLWTMGRGGPHPRRRVSSVGASAD